jgi:transposase InsO family protein
LPKAIQVDNGPEFISRAVNQWAYANDVALHFIDPGKPVQNAFIESLRPFHLSRRPVFDLRNRRHFVVASICSAGLE